MDLVDIIGILIVSIPLAAISFKGCSVLGRYNKRWLARAIAVLGAAWLAYVLFRLRDAHDLDAVVFVYMAYCQLIYMVSGALGWWRGRVLRHEMLAMRSLK